MNINEFLQSTSPIIDVRSPGEFAQGHIPGAFNLPLLDNNERAEVGTLYKQKGKEAAFQLGLKFVGPKLSALIDSANKISANREIRLYCARGGLRSSVVSQMFKEVGLKVSRLGEGYKIFRQWVLRTLGEKRDLAVIGGLTGSGKTEILHSLESIESHVVDLEGLANHRGSAFGMFGLPEQPTNEQFENDIATHLRAIPYGQTIWIEDESRMIGNCKISDALFSQMQEAPLYLIERPLGERLEILTKEYTPVYDQQKFSEATLKIGKRLGGTRTKEVISCLESGNLQEAVKIVLGYYDQSYRESLSRRNQNKIVVAGEGLSANEWAMLLLRSEHEHKERSFHPSAM